MTLEMTQQMTHQFLLTASIQRLTVEGDTLRVSAICRCERFSAMSWRTLSMNASELPSP
jgi:hypothetical protein